MPIRLSACSSVAGHERITAGPAPPRALGPLAPPTRFSLRDRRYKAYLLLLGGFLGVLLIKAWLVFPRGVGAGRAPLTHPYQLQVSLGVLGRREGLPKPRMGPGCQQQSLISHVYEFSPLVG